MALSASQSLRFYAGSYAVTDRAMAGTAVSPSAPHLRLAGAARAWGDGVTPTVTWRDGASARPGVGSFTADADLIDIRDRVGFGARGAVPLLAGAPVTVDRRGFDQVSLNSRGDVRLLGGQAAVACPATPPPSWAPTGPAHHQRAALSGHRRQRDHLGRL